MSLSGRILCPEAVEHLIPSDFIEVLSRHTGLFERGLSQEMQHEDMQGWRAFVLLRSRSQGATLEEEEESWEKMTTMQEERMLRKEDVEESLKMYVDCYRSSVTENIRPLVEISTLVWLCGRYCQSGNACQVNETDERGGSQEKTENRTATHTSIHTTAGALDSAALGLSNAVDM